THRRAAASGPAARVPSSFAPRWYPRCGRSGLGTARPATSLSRHRCRRRRWASRTRRWPISKTDIGRLRPNPIVLIGATLVVALAAVAVLAPQIVDLLGVTGPSVRNHGTVNIFGAPTGPGAAHPFGVDQMGRDLLARVIYGVRSSLEAGVLSALGAGIVG